MLLRAGHMNEFKWQIRMQTLSQSWIWARQSCFSSKTCLGWFILSGSCRKLRFLKKFPLKLWNWGGRRILVKVKQNTGVSSNLEKHLVTLSAVQIDFCCGEWGGRARCGAGPAASQPAVLQPPGHLPPSFSPDIATQRVQIPSPIPPFLDFLFDSNLAPAALMTKSMGW